VIGDGRESVPVSALNQFLYCPRRCALIHVEGTFAENAYTLEGRFQHDRADEPSEEMVDGVWTVRALPLWSAGLGLTGKADIVEFHDGVPYPVDYKHGRRKQHENDDVQLCAQALCLEEMLDAVVPEGAIYHVASKRRRTVTFTPDLRVTTEATAAAVHQILESGVVPAAEFTPRCNGCSLRGACLPEVTSAVAHVREWCQGLFRTEDDVPQSERPATPDLRRGLTEEPPRG
jgi:CRISPR-associated exonuclease Cas4